MNVNEEKNANMTVTPGNEDGPALIGEILAEAGKENSRIISEAEDQAQKRTGNAKRQCESISREAQAKAEEQAGKIRKLNESRYMIEKKRIFLRTQEKVHSLVMDRLRERFKELAASPEYKKIIGDWAIEGAMGLGASRVLITPGQSDAKIFTKDFVKELEKKIGKSEKISLTLSDKKQPAGHGVILSDPDGKLIFNNLLEARLERKRNEIRKIVSRELLTPIKNRGASS